MTAANNWFTVDKEGLAKLVASRGKIVLLHELISNAWDTETKTVEVVLEPIPGKAQAGLVVRDDDPDGFADLAHAYTLFAESTRKGHPTKRGRFNMGEKLVLALCDDATITTTTGTVVFGRDGTRKRTKSTTKEGSIFAATVRMTRGEIAEIDVVVNRLIPPPGVVTTYNGRVLKRREPLLKVDGITLPTVILRADGSLGRSKRQTSFTIFEAPGAGTIYEMGIPVVETGDGYDVDVAQKVPLNMERDNVTPAFLRQLRAEVLNAVHDHIDEEASRSSWVTDALSHDDIKPEAVRTTVVKRFGEDAVVYDPSDREANHTAASKEFNVVHGGSLPAPAWENVRAADALKPAGQVFPTQGTSVSGTSLPRSAWTGGMFRVEAMVVEMAHALIDHRVTVDVEMFKSPQASTIADYSSSGNYHGTMRFNLSHLGVEWFEVDDDRVGRTDNNIRKIVNLITHELAHHMAESHLSEGYHDALTDMAAKLALMDPGLFRATLRDLDHRGPAFLAV